MDEIPRDEFGPEYVVEVWDPTRSMRGFLVIDNTALGPGKGGLRMSPHVSTREVFRLARTMTWKNSLAGIPFGGAKSGVVWPAAAKSRSAGEPQKKKEFIQSFARALRPFIPKKYIAGPDVATGEREMQWFVEAVGNWKAATGKPASYCMRVFGKKGEKCGIPHEFGSTGFGVAHATASAARLFGVHLQGATVAIHGFGNVGTFAFASLAAMGARVVALADRDGSYYSRKGFSPRELEGVTGGRETLRGRLGKYALKDDEFWSLPVDILIPASVTDVVNEKNKRGIRARVIVEAGNIPMQESIEKELHRKGILVVPDFVANAGGVISSYAEYRGYNPKRMFDLVKRKVTATTEKVVAAALRQNRFPREVAAEAAMKNVRDAMEKRKETFSPR